MVTRLIRWLPILAVAAALLPAGAGAGTTTGPQLKLSPATGAPGSHFTATFTYSVSRCDLYAVGLWWDDPNYTKPIGGGQDNSSGQLCQVSIDAVVPTDHATPGTTYPVHAYSNPRFVSAGGGPGPSGSATYAVTAAPGGTGGAPGTEPAQPSSPSDPAAAAQGHTGTAAPATGAVGGQQTQEAGGAAESSSSPGAPDATDSPAASPAPGQTAPLRTTPLLIQPADATPRGIMLALGGLLLVLAAALAWVNRWGPLRRLLRR